MSADLGNGGAFTNQELNWAADALRRHEMQGRRLNDWYDISPSQRRKWIDKASIVLNTVSKARGTSHG